MNARSGAYSANPTGSRGGPHAGDKRTYFEPSRAGPHKWPSLCWPCAIEPFVAPRHANNLQKGRRESAARSLQRHRSGNCVVPPGTILERLHYGGAGVLLPRRSAACTRNDVTWSSASRQAEYCALPLRPSPAAPAMRRCPERREEPVMTRPFEGIRISTSPMCWPAPLPPISSPCSAPT
jgi:hypothetical protein